MNAQAENAVVPPAPKRANLQAAILEAQRTVGAVAKESRNTFHNYKYASAEHMLVESREALINAGVQVNRGAYELRELAGNIVCRMEMILCHPESGEREVNQIDYPVIPEKGRPLDKAVNGALTTSMAYWLRDLLLIPRLDASEIEVCGRDDRNYDPKAKVPSGKPASSNDLLDRIKDMGAVEVASPETVLQIRQALVDLRFSPEKEQSWLKGAGVSSWDEISAENADKALKKLNDLKAKAKTASN